MLEGGDVAVRRINDLTKSFSTRSLDDSVHNAMKAAGGAQISMGSQNMVLLPEDFQPGENDVVCGRGRKSFHHMGNSYFRDVVHSCLERYANASKVEKSFILSEVVSKVRASSPNGGFVKKDQSSGRWHEVGDFLAREKTSQAFRDALHDLYKSSNISKKKRRHAERGARHAYNRDLSSRSLCSVESGASGESFGYAPSTGSGDSGMIAGMAGMEIGFGRQGLSRSNSNRSMDMGPVPRTLHLQQQHQQLSARSLQLQMMQEPLKETSARSVTDFVGGHYMEPMKSTTTSPPTRAPRGPAQWNQRSWIQRSCPDLDMSLGNGDGGSPTHHLESCVEESESGMGMGPVQIVSMSMTQQQQPNSLLKGPELDFTNLNTAGSLTAQSRSLMSAHVGGILQLSAGSTGAMSSLAARRVSKPQDQLLRAHSQPNLFGTKSPKEQLTQEQKQQNLEDVLMGDGEVDMDDLLGKMEDDDFELDDLDDLADIVDTPDNPGPDILFDRLVSFSEKSGIDNENPFEPAPILESS